MTRRRRGSWTLLSVLVVLVSLIAGCAGPFGTPGGAMPAPATERSGATTLTGTLEWDGIARDYYVRMPEVPAAPVPLIVALHGQDGFNTDFEEATGLSEQGLAAGMAVAYPQGVAGSWNAGSCCGQAGDDEIDDIGFLTALIDELVSTEPIDSSRIYLTGFSNGGMMAYDFACAQSAKVAAVSVVGAVLVSQNCEPALPVSVLAIHTVDDQVMPIDSSDPDDPDWWPTLAQTLDFWAATDNCQTSTEQEYVSGLVEHRWQQCSQNAQVRLLLLPQGGHIWPVADLDGLDASAETISFVRQAQR